MDRKLLSGILSATSEAIEVGAKHSNQKEEEGINSSFMKVEADEDSASEESGKSQALVLAVKNYNPFKIDADLAPVLKARTPDGFATRVNKRRSEGTIVAEELENDVDEINAKIRANNKAFLRRVIRNAMQHVAPFLVENLGVQVQIKNYSEDVGEINADEEAFATSIAKKVMEDLAPYLAERRRRRRRVI
ncbi:hypothetical protein P8452_62100 [Trifolium repens]|jgi:hypothetical protein|nr:hypothetical protein QL285_039941 [Trifolium repens]WJX78924.1 hypothetical protein P8452_62100 [Trifolium repens]